MQTGSATQELNIEEAHSQSAEVKRGIEKETFAREITVERKKSMTNMVAILGGLVLIISALGFTFKDKIFPESLEKVVNITISGPL